MEQKDALRIVESFCDQLVLNGPDRRVLNWALAKIAEGEDLKKVLENPELFKQPRIRESLEAERDLKKLREQMDADGRHVEVIPELDREGLNQLRRILSHKKSRGQ